MTLAICLQCGKRKFGAWTGCSNCGFLPETPEDMSKSIMLSDHFMPAAELAKVAERLSEGLPLIFDEKSVREMAEEISSGAFKTTDKEVGRFAITCCLGWIALIVGMALLISHFFG